MASGTLAIKLSRTTMNALAYTTIVAINDIKSFIGNA